MCLLPRGKDTALLKSSKVRAAVLSTSRSTCEWDTQNKRHNVTWNITDLKVAPGFSPEKTSDKINGTCSAK